MESSSGSGNWSDDLLRAYAVFGLDPLEGADELGFRFPKLSVSFLREKAKGQLRDALGRWRKMRGKLDDDDGAPVERASLRTSRGRGAFGGPLPLNAEDGFRAGTPFEAPGDLEPDDIRDYIDRRALEEGAHRRAVQEWEDRGSDGPRPEPSEWLRAADAYEADDESGPTTAGTPEERLAYAEEHRRWEQADREWIDTDFRQRSWDIANRGQPKSFYDPLDDAGFSDRPTVLDREAFRAYEGLPLWRDPNLGDDGVGVFHRGKRGSTRSAREIMAQIQDAPPELHYIGTGTTGQGLYFGDYVTGTSYAGKRDASRSGDGLPELPMEDDGAVIRIKLHPDTKTITWEDLNYLHFQQGNEEEPLEVFAARMGYDVIIQALKKDSAVINVMNRSRMVVEDTGQKFDTSKVPPRPVRGPRPEKPERKRRGGDYDRESISWRSGGPLI